MKLNLDKGLNYCRRKRGCMSKDVYEIDKDGFADDWHIVLKNGKYFAEFVDLEIAKKFIQQMNGELFLVDIIGDKHEGLRLNLKGVVKQKVRALRFSMAEVVRHLDLVAKEYYIGNVNIVDQFLQLYCFDEHRPKEVKK